MKVAGELDHRSGRRTWDDVALNELRALIAEGTPVPVISAIIGRSQEAVYSIARRRGMLATRSRIKKQAH